MQLASRMSSIGTETAFEAAARARALEATGRSIVHLEIGEPDFDTPANVRDAAKHALDTGKTHYPPYPGIPELREAIAADSALRRGFAPDAADVFVTVGGKGVMYYAILALVNPGDEVIVPDPGYPIYESVTRFVGGVPVPIAIRQANDFRLDPDELASLVTDRTKLIVINSPANPTGGVLTAEDLQRIAAIAIERDLVVLSDEIYSRILYDGAEHTSIAALPGMRERTIVLDGFSKTWAMTGWRLGYGIVPEWLHFAFGRLLINSVSGATSFAQWGAVEAIAGPRTRWRRWSRSSGPAGTSSWTGSTRSPASGACGRPARSTCSPRSPAPACPARSSRTGCSTRPASPCLPAPRSARSASTTSGSRTRPPGPTSRRRCVGCGP